MRKKGGARGYEEGRGGGGEWCRQGKKKLGKGREVGGGGQIKKSATKENFPD